MAGRAGDICVTLSALSINLNVAEKAGEQCISHSRTFWVETGSEYILSEIDGACALAVDGSERSLALRRPLAELATAQAVAALALGLVERLVGAQQQRLGHHLQVGL